MIPGKCAITALAFTAACCGGNPVRPTSAAAVPIVTVSGLAQNGEALRPGTSVQLGATLRRADASNSDCTAGATWASTDLTRLRPTGRVPGEFLIVEAGDATASATCEGVTGQLSIHAEPGRLTISGRVLAGPGGPGVFGATLAYGSLAPVRSAADGAYAITTPGATTDRLVITAPGFQTRETRLRIDAPRTVDMDLIGGDLIDLYRRMARNGFESPQSVSTTPTRRWTRNPNIYIWTTWQDGGAPVRNVDFFVAEIRRVIPQLTGGALEAGVIETGPEQRAPLDGWIGVQFDHGGNNAYVGADPGRVQFAGDDTCSYQAITHEFGHAMGYWHTGIHPSVMGGGPALCAPSDLTPDEARVARAMYARAVGNVEPDRDPDAASFALGARPAPPAVIVWDQVIR